MDKSTNRKGTKGDGVLVVPSKSAEDGISWYVKH